METFTSSTWVPCSVDQLYAYHARPGALERLLPPWEKTKVLEKHGGISPGGTVKLHLFLGKIPLTYIGHHVKEEPGVFFQDIQQKGPFTRWSHTHRFSSSRGGCLLEDQVEYQLPMHQYLPGRITDYVHQQLQRTFEHRQQVLLHDLKRHQEYSTKPMKFLISGATGVIGRHLVPFLTTGGHQVWTLVRRQADSSKNEIYWNPAREEIDAASIPQVDAVIHLAGEYIGLGRWSEKRKRRVIESRVQGTSLLASTIAEMGERPAVFLTSSAVGIYGNCSSDIVTENRPAGHDFLSHICKSWESAASVAEQAGIRTVFLRMGIGLSSKGGALEKMINAPVGYIKRFGHGKQLFSWLSIDDLISAILHCAVSTSIEGPVNLASPNVVTNEQFIGEMARISSRPSLPGAPEWFLKLLFGEMARELLLSSCHASPAKLIESGFVFHHPHLQDALRSQLGVFQAKKKGV